MTPPAIAATESSAQTPFPAEQHLAVGREHQARGRLTEAVAAYRHGLESATADGGGAELTAELHAKLGNALLLSGHLDPAADSYKAALRLAPHLSACWCNLATINLRTGNAENAVALYLQALRLNPAHWPSRTNLAEALIATRQHLVAKALLIELTEERPQDAQVRQRLGRACYELGEKEAALAHFRRAVALNPHDAESFYWIGGINQSLGDLDAAQLAYAHAARITPLIRRGAVKSPADFRVLALFAPFAGNTPAEFLFADAAYDTDTLALLAASRIDAAALGGIDVVVNLISDPDQAAAELPIAAALAAQLGKAVVNDPAGIARTTRDAVASLLPGIDNCRVPKILRLDADADVSATALEAILPFVFPLLARPAGTHGGDDFEKIETVEALSDFLTQLGGDRYLIEYIDYASADGYFRKYRFIFVDDEILPYHLAIGGDWKLHHDSTDMADHEWMQREEAAFLANPGAVFDAGHYAALRAIRARIGLDYFGIDCGLDRDGRLVVFEVNASMLVHADNAEFPYKDPYVRAIKAAFDAMLRRRALS
ncbi:MAG TPA: tetratricopeptide repeat protein [Xanthobacteraceae bacterium]|nr:tetratricopeptide repeat protein [Xanthobacteraceae bacterium]